MADATTRYTEPQIMMTLAAISYAGWEYEIRGELAKPNYATQGLWNLTWGPHEDLDLAYRAFVVQNSANTNQYALVIRGSVLDWTNPLGTLIDWWNDLDAGHLDPFSATAAHGQIARGTLAAMNDLLALPSIGSAPKLSDYLKSLPATAEVFVTGHSLGAAQASVLAPWLAVNRQATARIASYTFASPTPGDATFAKFADTAAEIYRYWNQWDLIPHAFAPTDLPVVASWYPAPGPTMNYFDKALYDHIKSLPPSPNPYVQPGGAGIELKHVLQQKTSHFLAEVGDQHDKNLYLKLLGLDYSIGST
jgi:hypothetical protein